MTLLTFLTFVAGLVCAALVFGVVLALISRRDRDRPSERLDKLHIAIYGCTRAETERQRALLRERW
jgi:hypothetical protein